MPDEGEPTVTSAPDSSDRPLGSHVARGAIRLMLRNITAMGLQTVSSIILARHLTPDSYAAFALASTLVGLGGSVADLGLAQSLVVSATCSESDLGNSFGIALVSTALIGPLIGALGIGLSVALLGSQSPIFLTAAYAGTMIPVALQLTPLVKLSRDLRFDAIGSYSLISTTAGYACQILLLVCGCGVWSLVAAGYANALVGLVVLVARSGRLPRPRLGSQSGGLVREAVPYQGPSILSGVSGFVLPIVVVAVLGEHRYGLFSWANILATPIIALLATLQSVLIPSLSRLYHDDEARYTRAAQSATRLITLTSTAVASVLFGLAPLIVKVIFSARWTGAIPAVQVAVAGIVPTAMMQFFSVIVVLSASAQLRFRCSLAASLVTCLCAYPLMRLFGLTGAAIAAYLAFPVLDAGLLIYFARLSLRRSFVNLTLVAAPVCTTSVILDSIVQTSIIGLIEGVAGVIVVASLACWAVDRQAIIGAWSAVRKR